jgi:hypothetical protein
MVLTLVLCAVAGGSELRVARALGGTGFDQGYDLIEAEDGGFVLAAHTASFGAGEIDVLVSGLDDEGNELWTTVIGGPGSEGANAVLWTGDGGLAIAGYTRSFGEGEQDVFVVKLDGQGTLEWARTLGGTGDERAVDMVETGDGGFALAGYTDSGGAGARDALLLRLDPQGNPLWARTLGGTGEDLANALIRDGYGGFVISGYTESFGAGNEDFLLARFDGAGDHQWTSTLGGTSQDIGNELVWSQDGSLIVTGSSTGFGVGGGDNMLCSFDASGSHEWSRAFGGVDDFDRGVKVVRSDDGGYVVAAEYGNCGFQYGTRLIALDSSGMTIWASGLRGPSYERASGLVPSGVGGYALLTRAYIWETESWDLALVRFDGDGASCVGNPVGLVNDAIQPQISHPEPEISFLSWTAGSASPSVESVAPISTLICLLRCGDANGDGALTGGDGYRILNYFGNGPPPSSCFEANVNGDSAFTVADGYHLLNFHGAGPELDCQSCEF